MNILSYLKSLLNGNNKDKNTNSGSKMSELESFVKEQYDAYLPSKPNTPEPPSYERYEYEAPTDENIEQSAKAELGDYVGGENSIRSEYEQKAKELTANKASSEKQYTDSANKLKALYDEAAETLSNDSLKRGLARSSIAVAKQAAASKAYTDNANEMLAMHNQKMEELDKQINGLDGQLQNALNEFKISYAAKLTQRINELKEEREKHIQEALKYNNSLLSDEYEQRLKKEKTDNELYSDALSNQQREQTIKNNLSAEEKSKIEKRIYDKAVEILDSMSFDEAREAFFNDPIFRNSLSDYYYYTLYYKYR